MSLNNSRRKKIQFQLRQQIFRLSKESPDWVKWESRMHKEEFEGAEPANTLCIVLRSD